MIMVTGGVTTVAVSLSNVTRCSEKIHGERVTMQDVGFGMPTFSWLIQKLVIKYRIIRRDYNQGRDT